MTQTSRMKINSKYKFDPTKYYDDIPTSKRESHKAQRAYIKKEINDQLDEYLINKDSKYVLDGLIPSDWDLFY